MSQATSPPSNLAEKILWSLPFDDHPNDQSSSDDSAATPPTFVFPDGLLSEARATAKWAFSRATQMASIDLHNPDASGNVKQSLPLPIITLYYPHQGCNEIIDSMVKFLAREQGADVVVLDSLELALGEFGALGKEVAHTIDKIYSTNTIYSTNPDDNMIQMVFDNIVNIRREPESPHEGSSSVKTTTSRIVYMRDFGGISSSALPLVPYLLEALHTRRFTAVDNDSFEKPFQPTVLILGFAESPGLSSLGLPIKRDMKIFTQGGALVKLLPSLGNNLYSLSDFRIFPEHTFSSACFLQWLTEGVNIYPTQTNSRSSSHRNELVSGSVALSVLPKDSHTKDFRNVERRLALGRQQAIQDAWMMKCLRIRGAVVCENPLGSVQLDDLSTPVEEPSNIPKTVALTNMLYQRTDVPLPVALDHIATIAVGLASSQSFTSTAALLVTPAELSKACQLFIENYQARSDWSKAIMDKPDKQPTEHWKSAPRRDEDAGAWGGGWGGGWHGGDGWGNGYAWDDGNGWREMVADEAGKDETAVKADNVKGVNSIIQKIKKAKDLNKYEKRLLSCIVDSDDLDTTFDDVCIPSKIIDSLRTIVSLPLLYPNAFKSGILGKEAIGGVLLYGPPGTGKTLVCRALARECGARMLQLKPSDIMDYFIGESEKLAKAVFTLAYRLAPCVIFVDEMDSLFMQTGPYDQQYQRNILNEFLQAMDGLQSAKKNKECGIVVVGATNRPHELDDAILRRLPSRMMVDLPSEEEREQILRILLRNEKLDEEVNIRTIARNTPYYSGSDLKNLCVSAAMASVKDAIGNFSWPPKMSPQSNTDVLDLAADMVVLGPTPDNSDPAANMLVLGPAADMVVLDQAFDKPDPAANIVALGRTADIRDRAADKPDHATDKPDHDTDKPDQVADTSGQAEVPSITDEAESKIQNRTIKLAHFIHAIDEIAPSSSADSHFELRRWHDKYGQERTLDDSRSVKPQSSKRLWWK